MSNLILVSPDDQVKCPSCSDEFPLVHGISQQLLDGYEQEYAEKLSQERMALEDRARKQAERQLKADFDDRLEELQEKLAESDRERERVEKRSTMELEKATKLAREEMSEELGALRDQIKARDEQLDDFREQERELRKERDALELQRKNMQLDLQRELDKQRSELQSEMAQSFNLREAEYKKKIDDAQRANEDLKRKLDQGSQQLQGDVLEVALEEQLQQAYPLDLIEAVSTGVRGADIHQTVRQASGATAGTIVWEAKRAENWSNNWIPKLKDDLQASGAEIAVLVSTAYPRDVRDPFTQIDGVWLVRPDFARPLADALRAILIESARQRVASTGKNEKMEALYDYVCSAQFAQKVRAVLDAYAAMRDDLESEKRAMQRLWKKREGQLERITTNVVGMCGELQGLSTSGLPHLDEVAPLLQVDEDEDAA